MTLFLDTETTGLSPGRGDVIVDLAIVNEVGHPLIVTLVNPRRSIPLEATRIHGITSDMVRHMPSLEDLMPRIHDIVRDQHVVIYNSSFDIKFFPDRLRCAEQVSCAMLRFAKATGGPWSKLDAAARHVGHDWSGNAHRALPDALACRSVWLWLEKREIGRRPAVPQSSQPCPKLGCSGRLVERIGYKGPFMGCTNYPRCRYTEDVN